MRTFVLGWNPSTSDMDEYGFLKAMQVIEWGDISLGLWRVPEARSGDNFFLVRRGTRDDGIVAKGFFLTDPYKCDRGEYPYRIAVRPTFMVSPANKRGIIGLNGPCGYFPEFPEVEDGLCEEIQGEGVTKLRAIWDYYESNFEEDDFWDNTVSRSERPEAGINEAVAVASDAHYDYDDMDGKPVILHDMAVGLAGRDDIEIICGILHDVIEETEWTAGKIREKGFSEHIIDTLMLLTWDSDIPYEEHLQRIIDSGNETAIAVKMNALRQNIAWNHDGRYPHLLKRHKDALSYMTIHVRNT